MPFSVSSQTAPLRADFVIAVHNGALGDFLCCWPGLLAIARQCREQNEHKPRLYFYGPDSRLPWVQPLGFAPCPANLKTAVQNLYAATKLPAALAQAKIIWFCLDKPPALPVLAEPTKQIICLPVLSPPWLPGAGLDPNGRQGQPHVMLALKTRLEAQGWVWPQDWPQQWAELFGGWQGQGCKEIALLPGSGHCNKQWPLRNFVELAENLAAQGWKPLFIIGEAEQERGLIPPAPWPWINPSPSWELGQRLRSCRAVISNDSGPAHLSGMHGVPGIALFGPTSPAAWGVPGLLNLTPNGIFDLLPLNREIGGPAPPLPPKVIFNFNFNFNNEQTFNRRCSPCTVAPREINCPEPFCLQAITPGEVLRLLLPILNPRLD